MSSGARLNSSIKEAADAHGFEQGAVDEVVRAVVLVQDAGGVMVARPAWLGSGRALPSTKTSGIPHSAVIARNRADLLVPGGSSRGREH